MTDDGGVRHESIFRASWRDHHSAGSRPGELIKNPGWIDAGLTALAVLLIAGAVAAGTVTVELDRPAPASAGELVVPAERQRLINVFLPRFW